MNFKEHFFDSDIAAARLAFETIVSSLKLIDSYTRKGNHISAARITGDLTNALNDLNTLACRKESGKDMYLHHLLTQPQGWYPA